MFYCDHLSPILHVVQISASQFTERASVMTPLFQRISSLALPAQINTSQSSSNRHISTLTVERRLRVFGLYSRIAAKKPLPKDTNNNKRLAKKHEQWTLDLIFSSNLRVFVRRGVDQRLTFACVFPTVNMEEEVLWCGGVLLLTLSVIYFEFKAHLTNMANTAICSASPKPDGMVYHCRMLW